MFLVENNVPDIYINESRDFQLVARLYDLVFQSNRYMIDSLNHVSDTMRCNRSLLTLIGTKVGFFTHLELTDDVYRMILSAFPHIIKHKGSLKSIELILNLFQHIMNTKVRLGTYDSVENKLTLIFEDYVPNVELLYSLLDYVRPTGLMIDYKIQTTIPVKSDYTTSDKVTVQKINHNNNLNNTSSFSIVDNPAVGFTQVAENKIKTSGEKTT